jgi:hypothetical protein
MPSPIVRLTEIDAADDRVYVLNWLGLARRSPVDHESYEVFVRFVDQEGKSKPQDRWIRFECFPFLLLGSEWRNGIMVGKPAGVRWVNLDAKPRLTWHRLSKTSKPGFLTFDRYYPLAIDNPAAPVLEISTRQREILYVPLSELLRSHYLFDARLLPSFLGGLIGTGSLAAPSLQAWDPDSNETCWVEPGVAQIRRAKFLSDDSAKRVARLIFDPAGKANLLQLRRWIESHFVQNRQGAQVGRGVELPRLTLPYATGGWNVSTIPLERHPDGRLRSLVLHIVNFEADEPYRVLRVKENFTEVEPDAEAPRDETHAGGKVLKPAPGPELPIDGGDSDGRFIAISLDDIVTVDRASRRRSVVKPRNDGPDVDRINLGVGGTAHVGSGGLRVSGPDGKGRAPIVLVAGDGWPQRSETLRVLGKEIIVAAQRVVDAHRAKLIEGECSWLPDADHAYNFLIPRQDTEYSRERAVWRQFLVLEVRIANRFAYVIEPQQRIPTESFPLGVWTTCTSMSHQITARQFSSRQIEQIALAFEGANREGHSWIQTKSLKEEFKSVGVRHAPRDEPSETAMQGFRDRISGALFKLIGDARALG